MSNTRRELTVTSECNKNGQLKTETSENDDVRKKRGPSFLRGLVWIENNAAAVLNEPFPKVSAVVFSIMLD